MNRSMRIGLAVLGVIAGLWLVYRTADRMYLSPRKALLDQIASANSQINRYNHLRKVELTANMAPGFPPVRRM